MKKNLRGLLEGALGVGAATPVGDGRDLLEEQRALVLARAAGGDVIDARHHVVLGREGHDGHARGRGHHGEVGQQLADEHELAAEVDFAHAGRIIHQEDELQALAELPQPPHASPERLAQPLHSAPRRFVSRSRRRWETPGGPRRGLGEEAEAEIARRGHLLKGRPARNERQTPATKGQARPHRAGDRAAAPERRRRLRREEAPCGPTRRGACAERGAGQRPRASAPFHLTLGTDTIQTPQQLGNSGGNGARSLPLSLSSFFLPSLLLLSLPEAYKMFEGKGAVKKNLPLPSFSPSLPLPAPVSFLYL